MTTPVSASATSSAANEVLNIVELLEMILLHTHARTVLAAQRVNKHFKGVIVGSLALQRKLFRRPDYSISTTDRKTSEMLAPFTTTPDTARLLVSLPTGQYAMRAHGLLYENSAGHRLVFSQGQNSIIALDRLPNPTFYATAAPNAMLRPISCLSTFVTQPPSTEVRVVYWATSTGIMGVHRRERGVTNMRGVTWGDVFARVYADMASAQQARTAAAPGRKLWQLIQD